MVQKIMFRKDEFKFSSGLMVAMVLVWYGEEKYRSTFQIQSSLEAVIKQEQFLYYPQRCFCVSLTNWMNVMMAVEVRSAKVLLA